MSTDQLVICGAVDLNLFAAKPHKDGLMDKVDRHAVTMTSVLGDANAV
jgi:hypothetical protein